MSAMAPMSASHNVVKSETVGPYRIELNVLPPEPFYTKAQVKSQHVKSGMLIMSGAKPVQPNSTLDPNHHLIVHVFDRKSGKTLTNAHVSIKYQWIDTMGDALGTARNVPVVRMEAIGHGAMSTHYGNNVSMLPGTYTVKVDVNGKTATFKVSV